MHKSLETSQSPYDKGIFATRTIHTHTHTHTPTHTHTHLPHSIHTPTAPVPPLDLQSVRGLFCGAMQLGCRRFGPVGSCTSQQGAVRWLAVAPGLGLVSDGLCRACLHGSVCTSKCAVFSASIKPLPVNPSCGLECPSQYLTRRIQTKGKLK